MKTKAILIVAFVGVLTLAANVAQAGEIGHFAPGVLNLHDLAVPEPGFYGVLYNYGYATDRTWQMNDDSGSAAANPRVRDEVQAVGGQLGLTYVPWNAALKFHYFYEFAAEDRFQGQSMKDDWKRIFP